MKSIINTAMAVILLTATTGCALGSATTGYSITARSADGLSPTAEDHIIQRAKSEVIKELAVRGLLKNQESHN